MGSTNRSITDEVWDAVKQIIARDVNKFTLRNILEQPNCMLTVTYHSNILLRIVSTNAHQVVIAVSKGNDEVYFKVSSKAECLSIHDE